MYQTIKRLVAVFAAIVMSVTAFAQVTTSSMNGKVADASGEAVPGAAVIAVHTPSGTQYYAVTNNEGRYYINGMRAGGPYSVEISCLGYQTLTYTDVTLQLAEPFALNATLSDDTLTLTEAIVVSTASSKFATVEKTGAATNISSSQMSSLPTVSRSISDVTRLSPYGGSGMSFAGADGRTANFTVDGASFNNNFGLNSKLPGGGSPISLDAIDELQVVISPYDVRQTDFVGGGVNAITKSGTNTFKGTAYIYHKNENLRGDTIEGEQISGARATDRNTIYGATLGGPIIKNKLFFFTNFEYTLTPTVANRWRGSEDGVMNANNYISRTKLSDLQEVSNAVKTIYGYDTGSWTNFPADESNMKILARIDWNINDIHKLAVRYNYTLNNAWNAPNGTSMDGGTRMSDNRTSKSSMSFANSMYSTQNLVHSVSLDLNSRFSNNLSNQFLATFSKLDDVRGTNSDLFPFIDILQDDQNYMALGYELFTYKNAVHNTVWNVKDDLTYYNGNHKVTAGVSFEHMLADNIYMRNGTGYYRFASLQDFYDNIGWDPVSHKQITPIGAAPETFAFDYAYESNPDAAARVQYNKVGLYVQDEWQATDKLKLTAGLRVDGLFFNNDDIMTNNAIYDITYYPVAKDFEESHVDTGKWPTSKLSVSPRIGFTYDVLGDRSLKIRGGSGFFQGRLPLVFFTNMPTNSGMVKSRITKTSADFKQNFATSLGINGYPTVEALKDKVYSLGYPADITPDKGQKQSTINAVDPGYKMPQVWKTSLAVDYNLPTSFPLSLTVEGIYNKTINATTITDWSIPSAAGFAHFNGADARPIYPSGYRTNPQAFVLTNTNKGYGWSGNVTVNARPAEWISLMVAYTHTESKELTGMPGSDASSAFTYVPSYEGPNHAKLHNSQYVTPDRVVANATINDKSGNHYSFIYEAIRGGYNYSYMMQNDMNSDGYNYDALYIPTDEQVANNQFRFVSNDDAQRFMDYVHNSDYLSKHQGEYAGAYSLYSPWLHRLDFSWKHDIKLYNASNDPKCKNALQLSLDIKNVLNIFNTSWGVAKYLNPNIGTDPRILKYEGVDGEGYPTFSTPASISGSTQTFVPYHAISQCWYASIGIKYMFN